MTRPLPILCLLLLPATLGLAQTTAPSTAPGPAALPTTADIQKQIDDAQYRDALKNILRVLDLKGAAAAPYSRGDILILRAECQLQLRQTQLAQDALDAAVKEARGTGNPPLTQYPDIASRAWALSALITKSPNMLYTPKAHTGPVAPKPVNILDRAARPAACKALFDDSLAQVQAQVHAAVIAGNLPPVIDAAKSVSALRALERAGAGSDVESKQLADDLSGRAATLLSLAIGNMFAEADAISQGANLTYTLPIQQVDLVTGIRGIVPVVRRRGLLNDEPARLKNIQQTCGQIESACVDLHLALDAADTFRPMVQQAIALGEKAGAILNDDYTRPPPAPH